MRAIGGIEKSRGERRWWTTREEVEQEEMGKQRAILPCQVQYDVSLLKLVAWRRAWFKLNLQIFGYFIFGPREREKERERVRFQGRFVTYSLAGEFNSFRYKYISSGRSWEITFAGIMAKNTKTSAEITQGRVGWARGDRLNFAPGHGLNYEKSVRYFESAVQNRPDHRSLKFMRAIWTESRPCLFPCQHIYG